jgi:hypothetical protein
MTTITQVVTALSPAPTRADPASFASRGDVTMTELPIMVTQLNTANTQINTVIGELNTLATTVATNTTTSTTQAGIATAAAANAVGAATTTGTSTTSLSLTAGTKNITTQTGKFFAIGASVKVARTSDVLKWMVGNVVSYDSGTGALVLSVVADDVESTGTFTDWTLSITGHRGKANVPTPSLPIGSMLAMGGQLTNPAVLADATVWLRSGTMSTTTNYPNAIKAFFPIIGGEGSLSGDVVAGNGLLVGKSDKGVSVSSDMFAWTSYSLPASSSPRGFVGSVWVFTQGVKSWTTTDFITYTPRANLAESLTRIVVTNGVMFGFTGATVAYCYTTADGVTWAKRTLPSGPWVDVAYSGTHYVAVADGGACARSTDLVTWVSAGAGPNGPSRIAFMPNVSKLVVVSGSGAGSYAYSSDHGVTFTGGTFPTIASGVYGAAYTNGVLFVNSISGDKAYATSTDGITFSEVLKTSVGSQANLTISMSSGYGPVSHATGSIWVPSAGLHSKGVFTTDTAANFYVQGGPSRAVPINARLAGSATAAVACFPDNGYISRLTKSGDSVSSRQANTGLADSGPVAYSGTAWVVVQGGGSTARRSTDGLSWSSVTTSSSVAGNAGNNVSKLAAKGTTFIGISSGTTATLSTDDGLTWGATTLPAAFRDVRASASLFLGLGEDLAAGLYYTSTTGTTGTWTARSLPVLVSDPLRWGGYDGVRWAMWEANAQAVSGSTLYTSTDGITWTATDLPVDSPAITSTSSIFTSSISGGVLHLSSGAGSSIGLLTKDGGATWIYGSGNVIDPIQMPYQMGYLAAGGTWNSVATDYCGYGAREQMAGGSITKPTYYQRIA